MLLVTSETCFVFLPQLVLLLAACPAEEKATLQRESTARAHEKWMVDEDGRRGYALGLEWEVKFVRGNIKNMDISFLAPQKKTNEGNPSRVVVRGLKLKFIE